MSWPPTPTGEVTVDTPDGVTKSFGFKTLNSLYDAQSVWDRRSYGAFPQPDDPGLYSPPRRSNGDVK